MTLPYHDASSRKRRVEHRSTGGFLLLLRSRYYFFFRMFSYVTSICGRSFHDGKREALNTVVSERDPCLTGIRSRGLLLQRAHSLPESTGPNPSLQPQHATGPIACREAAADTCSAAMHRAQSPEHGPPPLHRTLTTPSPRKPPHSRSRHTGRHRRHPSGWCRLPTSGQ